MDEKEQKLLEFLLADFNAMKNEIARRSSLQKAAIVALVALYAWIFNKTSINVEVIIISWVAAILVAIYVYREHREISRLGWLIKNKVASQAGEIIDVDENLIIPSEAHASDPGSDFLNKFISTLFLIVIIIGVPLYLTYKHNCLAKW